MWRHHSKKKPVFLGSQKQGICDKIFRFQKTVSPKQITDSQSQFQFDEWGWKKVNN